MEEDIFRALINLVEINDVMHVDRHISVKKEENFPFTCFHSAKSLKFSTCT